MNRPGRAVAKLNLLLLAVLVACASLAGCAAPAGTINVPTEVKVPTPVACVDQAKRPKRPQLRPEAELMLMDRGRRTLAVWADWLKQQIYLAELEAVVEGCSRIPVPG